MREDPWVLGRPPARPRRHFRLRLPGLARVAIAAGTMLLLTSLGGAAIIASPIVLPALWWGSRSASPWVRTSFAFLAALVMTEVGWFIAYSAIGEKQPYIAMGPALGFMATIVFFLLTGPRRVDAADVTGRGVSDSRS